MQRPIFQQLDRTPRLPYPFSFYVRRLAWAICKQLLFHWSPFRAFGWRRFVLRCFGAKVTPTSIIYRTVSIYHPWLLEVGEHTTIAKGVDLYNIGSITIGSHTIISQRVVLCAGSHDLSRADLPLLRPPIHVGSGVWIATEAFIGPGVTIGDNSVVGARAAVFRDVPPGMVVSGNPAVIVQQRPMIDDEDPVQEPATAHKPASADHSN